MSEINSQKQVAQIKAAIDKVVEVGPDFLSSKIPAHKMAHTMVNAVHEFAQQAEKKNGKIHPESPEAAELLGVLQEINGCGSGFLDDRCDSACVARTISYIMDEFSDKEAVK